MSNLSETAEPIVVVTPTFNERGNVERLIPALFDTGLNLSVCVVDDNSPDGTGATVAELAARDARVHLLSRTVREGIGPAYVAGFEWALRNGATYIVQMDADFSHPVDKVADLVAAMRDYDLALGSRYLNGIAVVNWSMQRLLLSYCGNWYARRMTGLPVADVTGGFKCWRREALQQLGLQRVRSNGYAFQIETTYRAWCGGMRITEIPIVFVDRTVGESKLSPKLAREALWIVWWLRLMHRRGQL